MSTMTTLTAATSVSPLDMFLGRPVGETIDHKYSGELLREFFTGSKTFVATDITGVTDVTSELQEFIEDAAGAWVFIPPGIYSINMLTFDSSARLWARPGTVTFINEPTGQAISNRDLALAYQNANTSTLTVTDITLENFADPYPSTDTDYVHALTITESISAVDYAELWSISTQVSEPFGSDYWVGETFKTLGKNAGGTKLYVTGKLEYFNELANTRVIAYTSGSGTVPAAGTTISQGGVTSTLIGVHSTLAGTVVASGTTMPATGYVRVKDKSGGNFSAGALTGLTATASGADTMLPAKLNKWATGRVIDIRGINFAADGNWRDQTVGPTSGYGLGCLNLFFTPYVNIEDCTFDGCWEQAVELRGCPASHVHNCTIRNLTNAMTAAYTLGNNPLATTNGQAYVTVTHTGHNLTTGTYVTISGLAVATYNNIPSTQINGEHMITVIDANTYRFTTAATANAGTSFGGAAIETEYRDRLGYGVLIYGQSSFSIVENIFVSESRHAVTTGGEGASWSTTRWMEWGSPTHVIFRNIYSYGCYGIPFDTHESGSSILFENCTAIWPARGPTNGSYAPYGIQLRARNCTVKGYYQKGGNYGIRFPNEPQPGSTHIIESATFETLVRSTTSQGIALVFDDISGQSVANRYKVIVGDIICNNVETGAEIAAGHNVQIAKLYARNLTNYGVNITGASTVSIANIDLANTDGTTYPTGILTSSAATTLTVGKANITSLTTGSTNSGIFINANVNAVLKDIYVDGGEHGIRQEASGGTLVIHKAVLKNQNLKALLLQSGSPVIDDIMIDGAGTLQRGIDVQTGTTAIKIGKAKIKGIANTSVSSQSVNMGIQLASASIVASMDDVKIETIGGSGSYGIYTNQTGIALTIDRLVVDTAEFGTRFHDSGTYNIEHAVIRNTTTNGMAIKASSTLNIGTFIGKGNTNDNLEGEQDVAINIAFAYINDGKSFIDCQKNTRSRIGHLVADYRGNAAAATCHLFFCRSDVTAGGSDTAVDHITLRKDDAVGLPQYVFNEQDTTAAKKVWVGSITQDNWNGVVETKIMADNATTLTYNANISKRNMGTVDKTYTQAPITITGITKASPAVVTANSHGYSSGDLVMLSGVGGMTEVNGNIYRVASATTNTFALNTLAAAAVNSTAYTTYTSGGTVNPVLKHSDYSTDGMIYANNASAQNIGLAKNAQIGAQFNLTQKGAGQVSLLIETGATLRNRASQNKTNAQYAVIHGRVMGNSDGNSADWLIWGDTGA